MNWLVEEGVRVEDGWLKNNLITLQKLKTTKRVEKKYKSIVDVGATSEQKHEPSDQQKWNQNSENWNFAKTQKRSKLKIFTSWDRKFVHPPDFGKGKPEQPKVLAHG